MLRQRSLLAAALALALGVAQISTAAAAPLGQVTTITGTVQSVQTSTDSSGQTVIVVTFTDSSGATQVANLSVSDATALGLITVDGSGNITIVAVPGQAITLGSNLLQVDPCTLPKGASQPVGEALTSFFCGSLGVDFSTIDGWHSNGFGYGVITQALLMAQLAGGDSKLADQILMAKQTHDFSKLVLPDGSTPRNWGQLLKDAFASESRSLMNLGAIMSGRAQPQTPTTTPTTGTSAPTLMNGNGKGHGNGHGRGGQHGQGGQHVP